MANNLYGGYLYQGTPFVFDKTYDNYTQMIEDKSHPLIGRFVLIKYCEDILTQNIMKALKKQVEENITTDTLTYFDLEFTKNNETDAITVQTIQKERGLTEDEKKWRQNYKTDYEKARGCADRTLYQISYNGSTIVHEPIGILTTTMTDEMMSLWADYVKFEDQKINDKLDEEITRSKAQDKDHKKRIETMEVFWESADNSAEAIDTLRELQSYIKEHTSDASDIIRSIQSNASDIAENAGDIAKNKGAITALQNIVKDGGTLEKRVDLTENRLNIIQGTSGDGSIMQAFTNAKKYTDNKAIALEAQISNEAATRAQHDSEINAKIGARFTKQNTVAQVVSAMDEAYQKADRNILNTIGNVNGTVAGAITEAKIAAISDATAKIQALENGKVATNASNITLNARLIADETDAREKADKELSDRIDSIDAFFATKDDETLDTALDTLKEIQNYLNGEGTASGGILDRISTAEADITAHTNAIELLNKATTWQKFPKPTE